MNIIVPITEFITYILYAILVGHIALKFVPEEMKPSIKFSNRTVYLIIVGILFFSLGSVLDIILFFQNAVDFKLATYSVFVKTEVGKAWVFSSLFAVMLIMNIYINGNKFFQLFWLMLMIFSIGYAGHISSLDFWTGFIFQSIHFLMVSIWSGILIHVAWFSKDTKNYSEFLKWFTPWAISSVVIIFISGFVLMIEVVKLEDYINAWILPYGQMLLLKHISIIPVLFFAFFNGVLIKKSVDYSKEPFIKKWLRAESIILTFVFFFTGMMSTKSPAHDIDFTIRTEGPSKWIEYIMGIDIVMPMKLYVTYSVEGIMLMCMSLIFLVLLVFSFIKKTNVILSITFGLCFVFTMYIGLMYSVSSN